MLLKELDTALFESKMDVLLLLEALTATPANMTFSYERLEFLGDAFLKYLSTVYIVVLEPEAFEDQMHMMRSRMVQNSTLWQVAERACLPQFIQSRPAATAGNFLPPGFRRNRKLGKPLPSENLDGDAIDFPSEGMDEEELLQAETVIVDPTSSLGPKGPAKVPKWKLRSYGKKVRMVTALFGISKLTR